MTTLVIPAASPSPAMLPLLRRRPFPLLPLLGKPLVDYQLELASSLGATRVAVLCDSRPEMVRAFVHTGQAWGLEVDVVALPRDLELAAQLERLPAAYRDDGDLFLLAADALVPPLAGERGRREPPSEDWEDDQGWLLVRQGATGRARQSLPDRRLRDPRRFLGVQLALLDDPAGFVLPGFEVAPGIRISRGSRLSLAAVVAPPVLVGDHARVSDRAELGPGVAIGPRCLIDDETALSRCVVLPRTYVGRLLAGSELVLDGPLIVNTANGSVAAIDDELLLADLDKPLLGGRFRRLLHRLGAMVLTVPLSPLMLVAWLAARRPRVLRREVFGERTRLSVAGAPERQLTRGTELNSSRLLLRRLGWLLDAAAGRIALVGNPPLEPARAAELEPALRHGWLEAPVGAFGLAQSEALAAGGPLDRDQEAMSAALYAARRTTAGDLGLILRGLAAFLSPKAWRARQD